MTSATMSDIICRYRATGFNLDEICQQLGVTPEQATYVIEYQYPQWAERNLTSKARRRP